MRSLRTSVLLLVAALPGCATITLVTPERQTVGDVISVEPGRKWNKLALTDYQGRVEVWTLDGAALNTLVFFTGVPDGEPLFTRRVPLGAASQQEKPAVFKSSMNPLEVQELLEATVARHFQTTIAEGRNLKPQPIGGGAGFRFETRMLGRDEVERHGVFVGTIRRGKLYGAWFQGAKLHYYARYLPDFDRMVSSARLVGEAATK